MAPMVRREAIGRLAGTGTLALLGLGGHVPSSARGAGNGGEAAALVQATLTPAHAEGRCLKGFVETGIRGGQVLCSLVRQDAHNPAVQSVFAAPAEEDGVPGVDVTVSFFTEPTGELTFSLLHVCHSSGSAPAIVARRPKATGPGSPDRLG